MFLGREFEEMCAQVGGCHARCCAVLCCVGWAIWHGRGSGGRCGSGAVVPRGLHASPGLTGLPKAPPITPANKPVFWFLALRADVLPR